MVGGNNWIPYPEIGNDGGSNPKTYGIGQTVELSSEWGKCLEKSSGKTIDHIEACGYQD